MMRENETVPDRFLRVRNKFGLTQPQMAEKLGIAKNYVYLLEKGKNNPSAKLVSKLDLIESDPDGLHRSSVKVRSDRMYGSLPDSYEPYVPGSNPGIRKMSREDLKEEVDRAMERIWEMPSGPKLTHRCHYIMDFLFELGNRREKKRDL